MVSPQQFGSLLDEFIALDVFFTDIEQTDRWPGVAFHRRHQRRTHQGKLMQVQRRTIYISTQIQHVGWTVFLIGQDSTDRRSINAGQGLENVA